MEIEFNDKLAFLFEPARLKIGYGGRGAIYAILNLLNGKIYIGSAVNFKARWRQHKHDLRQNKHINKHLQFAWNNNNESTFEFIILEMVDIKTNLKIKEQYWMDLTQSYNDKLGYNFCNIAGSSLGVKRSAETKEKISKKHKGLKRTIEFKSNLSKLMTGKKHTKTAILNMIEAQKNNDKRKLIKWPHELGIKCRCFECKENKKIYMRNWRASKNAN